MKLRGERCSVYVAEPARPGGYYTTWCDGDGERPVRYYLDPAEAIRAGLHRAAREDREEDDGG